MIDVDKCRECTHIRPLVEQGLGASAISGIATAANFDRPTTCDQEPELMQGGWLRCNLPPDAAAGLRGAASLLVEMQTDQQLSA